MFKHSFFPDEKERAGTAEYDERLKVQTGSC